MKACVHRFVVFNIVQEKCVKCGLVRTPCEVYSRVVGYIRPITSWNDSKQAEFRDRKLFKA